MEKEWAAERQKMVSTQLISRGIHNPEVLEAMRKVPRHQFVPLSLQHHAYDDGPLPIGEGQTISQPFIVALMTEKALPGKNAKALEVGTGSGYGAAVLSQICKQVITIERLSDLTQEAQARLKSLGYNNVICLVGDGSLGAIDYAPFDCILVTASAPAVPLHLKQQLAVGGTMVIPVGDNFSQNLLCIHRVSENEYTEKIVEAVRFVPLIGEEGW